MEASGGDDHGEEPAQAPDGGTAERSPLTRLGIGLYGLFYLGFAPCLILWMTFTGVLVGAEMRGAVCILFCRYFTGAYVAELRAPTEVGGVGQTSCPLMLRGHSGRWRGAGGG